MTALMRSAAAGAVAGSVATLAMSTVLFAGRRAGLFRHYPPEKVVKESTDPGGPLPTLDRSKQENAWPLVHFDLGAAFGVLYGVSRRKMPAVLRTPLGGASLGVGLWLLNYGMLAPALGLLPPAPRDDNGRQLTNAAAHAVFGASLAALLERGDR